MKICPQICVKGSVEAAEFYIKAFNGTLGFHAKNEDGTYEHADIMMGDSVVLALCESRDNADFRHMGTQEAVLNAYNVLKEGAVKNYNPNGPEAVPWNKYCFALVDKYNIFWWIAI